MKLLHLDDIHRLNLTRMWSQFDTWLHGHLPVSIGDMATTTRPLGPYSLLLPHLPPRE